MIREYIKQAHRNLCAKEYIAIRLVEGIDVNILRTDTVSGDDNVLLIIRENGNTIIINVQKIIMASKRKMR